MAPISDEFRECMYTAAFFELGLIFLLERSQFIFIFLFRPLPMLREKL